MPEENLRKEGVEYFDGDDYRFSDRGPPDKLLNEILTRALESEENPAAV